MSRLAPLLVSALAGSVFALGLALGGMTRTDKVVGFLDLFGAWDPALAFVMGGAIGVHALAYVLQRNTSAPWLGGPWHLPTTRGIDVRLVAGAVLFGVGWGLSGLCPGPAVMNTATLDGGTLAFVAAMVVGMALENVMSSRLRVPESDDDDADIDPTLSAGPVA